MGVRKDGAIRHAKIVYIECLEFARESIDIGRRHNGVLFPFEEP